MEEFAKEDLSVIIKNMNEPEIAKIRLEPGHFTKSNYDDLKNVRSIWICMDSADDEDSINRIRFTQENVYGKKMQLDNIGKVQGIIIRLRKNENVHESKNVLIAMLEELLRRDDAEAKKKKREDNYGIHITVETERIVYVILVK